MYKYIVLCFIIIINIIILCNISKIQKAVFHHMHNNNNNEKVESNPVMFESIKNDQFVPTHEWQHVNKDQPLPHGVHVRINMQTGEREVKLLEPSEEQDSEGGSLAVITDESQLVDIISKDKLEEAMKNIDDGFTEITGEDVARVKSKFRTYEEIKNDMADLHLNIETDMEILEKLREKFKSQFAELKDPDPEREQAILTTLTDLEFLLHQNDNAIQFAKVNGISDIIMPCLISNSTSIRKMAASVLGSAAQNNPKVQIAALEGGVISPLLRIVALERDYNSRSSALFALSCVVRSFPTAQLRFVENGGLSTFVSLFDKYDTRLLKLQLKVITFISDLLEEKYFLEQTMSEQNSSDETRMNVMKESLRQYNLVRLDSMLVDRGWCTRLSDFFLHYCAVGRLKSKDNIGHNIETEEFEKHDIVQRISNAIFPIAGLCKGELESNEDFNDMLAALDIYYKKLREEEMADNDVSYFSDIYDVVHQLRKKFQYVNENAIPRIVI